MPSTTTRTRRKPIMRAVRRFLAWAEGQGVELAAITPGMVGQYLVGLGGSAAKRNQHLSALRGFFDRLVNRHVVHPQPGGVGEGRQGTGDRGQDAGDHHRAGPDAAGVDQATYTVKVKGRSPGVVASSACGTGRSSPRWPIPPAGPGRSPSCGCRISSTTASSTCCGSRRRAARAGKSRCGTNWRALYWPMSRRRASRARPRIGRCSGRRTAGDEAADRQRR